MSERISKAALLGALCRHVGAHRGATAAQLVREITGTSADDYAMRCLRHAVEELRREGHHICAHPSAGYYIAKTPDELDRTCEYLYHRAMCSLQQIAAMKRISLPDLRGQLHLPD